MLAGLSRSGRGIGHADRSPGGYIPELRRTDSRKNGYSICSCIGRETKEWAISGMELTTPTKRMRSAV